MVEAFEVDQAAFLEEGAQGSQAGYFQKTVRIRTQFVFRMSMIGWGHITHKGFSHEGRLEVPV